MKLVLVSFGMIAAIIAAFFLGTQFARHPEIDAVRDLNLQKTCSEAAARIYESESHAGGGWSYSNHYNTRLRKCLIAISNLNVDDPGPGRTTIIVRDALERDLVAFCTIETSDSGKRQHATICFKHNATSNTDFKSKAEWDAYVTDLLTT